MSWQAAISPIANAHDLFEYQGGYNRSTGGAGTIMSQGGESVFFNPANLWRDNILSHGVGVDLGLTNLQYSITTPEVDIVPGKISIPILPLPSIHGHTGFSILKFGLFAFPTGVGSTVKVEQLPVELEGQYLNLDVESQQFGYKLGLGVGVALGSQWSIGVSLINDVQRAKNTVFIDENSRLNTEFESSFVRPIFGIRWDIDRIANLAFSFQADKRYSYKLKRQLNDGDIEEAEAENYKPRVFSLGASSKLRNGFQPYVQYNREIWIPATEFAQTPTQAAANSGENRPQVEFLDTNNIVLGFDLKLSRVNSIGLAYSYFSPNKGPGLVGPDGEVAFVGVGPQDFEGLQREHVTVSFKNKGRKSHLLFYGTYVNGNALNPEGTPNAAFYELDVYMLGMSYSRIWESSRKKTPMKRKQYKRRKVR